MGGTIAALLMSLVGPMARRVLLSLGIGVVSYVGVDAAVTAALDSVRSALSGLSGDALQIMALSGIFQGLGIMAGGIMARVSMMVLKRFAAI